MFTFGLMPYQTLSLHVYEQRYLLPDHPFGSYHHHLSPFKNSINSCFYDLCS